jgi:hypothetical protein
MKELGFCNEVDPKKNSIYHLACAERLGDNIWLLDPSLPPSRAKVCGVLSF